jgi:hypothetical protein
MQIAWTTKLPNWKIMIIYLYPGDRNEDENVSTRVPSVHLKTKYFQMKKIVLLEIAIIVLATGQLVGQNQVKPVNDFLKDLRGTLKPSVCWYTGSILDSTHAFFEESLKTKESQWICEVNPSVKSDQSGKVLDLTLTVKLEKGTATQAGAAVAFNFSDWSADNYVLIPASVYNGNRNKIEQRGYCTGFNQEDFYNKDIPQITTDLPQLSPEPGLPSKIDISTCNAATPSVCFFDSRKKRGCIILTEQGIRKDGNTLDYGLKVEESGDRSTGTIVISAPGVRERKPEFIGFGTSPDRGINWKPGDKVVIHLRVYSFETPDIPGLLDKFMTVRKDVTGPNHPRNLVPLSEVIKIMTRQIDKRWLEKSDYKYYCPENSEKVCIGWIGGLMNTFPMLVLNDNMHRYRVVKTLDFAIPAVAGKSGFFMAAMNPDGKTSGRDWFPNQPIVLTRQNADALFWLIKQFMILKAQGNSSAIKPEWEKAVNQLAQAFVSTWEKYGQWGNYINYETGEIAVYNTSSGVTAIGGLALASKWFNNSEFLKIAKKAAGYYYQHYFVQKGFTNGACSDILQNADSETAAGLMTSLMALYETTDDKKWLEMSRNLANLAATWVVSYDYELPKETELAKLKAKLAGVIWASTQNKHGAPGFCTSSGDPLFKIYRATGDSRYAELMRDIVHAYAEGIKPDGAITERLTYCDADNRGSRGGDEFGSTGWCELNGILMAMELPGIYLVTDENEFVVFDHVDADVISRDTKGVTLTISNTTKYDASISIFAENSKQKSKPLGYIAFLNWPKVEVKSGAKKTIRITPEGKIQDLNTH